MKRHIFLVWTIILFILLCIIVSCASSSVGIVSKGTVIFDENIPESQQAVLVIPGGYWEVIEFSGIKVRWWSPTVFNNITVYIPSGVQTIKFHYYPGTGRNFNNITFTYNFLPGSSYKLQDRIVGRDIELYILDTSGN